MKYTKNTLGIELLNRLDKQYNILKISQWAYEIFCNNLRELTPEIQDILECLFMMEEGPEFELTERELRIMAQKLIQEEVNILDQIQEIVKKQRSQ